MTATTYGYEEVILPTEPYRQSRPLVDHPVVEFADFVVVVVGRLDHLAAHRNDRSSRCAAKRPSFCERIVPVA